MYSALLSLPWSTSRHYAAAFTHPPTFNGVQQKGDRKRCEAIAPFFQDRKRPQLCLSTLLFLASHASESAKKREKEIQRKGEGWREHWFAVQLLLWRPLDYIRVAKKKGMREKRERETESREAPKGKGARRGTLHKSDLFFFLLPLSLYFIKVCSGAYPPQSYYCPQREEDVHTHASTDPPHPTQSNPPTYPNTHTQTHTRIDTHTHTPAGK